MEQLLFYSIAVFFLFWVINYSEILEKLRAAVFPVLPRWIGYPLSCSVCFSFWITGALCFFVSGVFPLVLTTPVCVMMLELIYLRLKGDK